MNAYYLKAADEAALTAALEAAGILTTIDGEQGIKPGYHLDVIGILYKGTGQFVEDAHYGSQVEVMAPVEGWHANLLASLTPEQEAMLPLVPTPRTPARVWA